jgi:hypothetical protein
MPWRPAEKQPEDGAIGSVACYSWSGCIGHQAAEYAPGDCIGTRNVASLAD